MSKFSFYLNVFGAGLFLRTLSGLAICLALLPGDGRAQVSFAAVAGEYQDYLLQFALEGPGASQHLTLARATIDAQGRVEIVTQSCRVAGTLTNGRVNGPGDFYFSGPAVTTDCSNSPHNFPSGTISVSALNDNTLYFAIQGPIAGGISGHSGRLVRTSPLPGPVNYAGSWYNHDESGWGLSIIRGASGAYGIIMYHFNRNNAPEWYFMSGGSFAGNTYTTNITRFTGPYFGTNPSPFTVGTSVVGTATIVFHTAYRATITYTMEGVTVSKMVSRYDF